jgi:DNA repair photolyase
MELIPAKMILSKTKNGDLWFGIDYNMNLYKGCSHGCIYCDSRSNCYQIKDFDKVKIKENVIEILQKEIKSKRKKGVIGIGAMSDTYNPFEKKLQVTRKALALIESNGFGVSIETKSDLIVRDIDIFKKINEKADVILKFTITAADDKLSKIIEPNVCETSKRLAAMKKLSDEGIFVGILLTPIIPFITDSEENIKKIIELSAKNGAKFIYSIGGVTLRENQREYFYSQLDKNFPRLKQKYISTYQNKYYCKSLNKNLGLIFKRECEKYGLLYKMEDIVKAYKKEELDNQISLFDLQI